VNLAPLRSAVGILECWNNGIMGSEKMGHWFGGRIHVDRETINDRIPFETNIPTFHHSMFKAIAQPSKNIPSFSKLWNFRDVKLVMPP
jgi:hypothetical protein